MKVFEIRKETSLGRLVGKVEASDVFAAAVMAAQAFYGKPAAFRISGWGGKGGTFQAADKILPDHPMTGAVFYVKEIDEQ
jgi:hypothetical protein